MKKLFLIAALWLAMPVGVQTVSAQSYARDIIHLNDGNVVRGTILEIIPNETVTVRTGDSVLTYDFSQVQKIDKQFAEAARHGYRNPGLAWVLSFILPGAGQFYNGDIGLGIGFLVTTIGGYLMVHGGTVYMNGTVIGAGLLLMLGSSLASMIQAPIKASKLNRQNGFLTFDIGRGVLGVSPALALAKPQAGSSRQPITAGMNVSFSF